MSQRFCLFYAGYTAYAPSLYYDQVMLYDLLRQSENQILVKRIENLSEDLEQSRMEGATFIDTSLSIAGELDIKVLPKPHSHLAYFEWRQDFISRFEGEFPMTKIDHYYFLFGRRIAELVCNSALAKKYLLLVRGIERNDLVIKKTDKALKDMEYILAKMMASAALLSGEIRHHYFSLYYKEISSSFKPFTNLEIRELSDEQLDDTAMALENYGLLVMNGFKKCIGLLKDLGV